MSEIPHDIKDDEIRIIISKSSTNPSRPHKQLKRRKLIAAILIAIGIVCVVLVWRIALPGISGANSHELEPSEGQTPVGDVTGDDVCNSIVTEDAKPGFVVMSDTVINRVALSIFRPVNLIPSLQIGPESLDDPTVRFIAQAADVREDNGGIVGTYVDKGQLISKGQAKSGYCAIIGGKINIGVADATPFLEQALETDGYFFRQYPLVVANQVVENKPKGDAFRKALAELDGEPVVIISRDRVTFHDFSQRLVDLGVSNAIYLVGGNAYGYAIGEDEKKTEFGQRLKIISQNTNYIVWR